MIKKLRRDAEYNKFLSPEQFSKFDIGDLVERAVKLSASDIHISVASKPLARVNGVITPIAEEKLTPNDTYSLVKQILNDEQFEVVQDYGEIDCSYSRENVGRFRVNVFKQRNTFCMVMRLINFHIPDMAKLGLPPIISGLSNCKRGLILVTGPTGSGKSTTLASMIDYMNKTRNDHVVTIEDPIEYLHRHGTCLINQREIGTDTLTFANALRASLREDPDIILVGEMRDQETISTALTAAETGHLVLSTLHTMGCVKTIDRIIDVFEPHQQQQVRIQLASIIEAVISQQLLPTIDGNSRVVALEIMVATPAIRNLIREGKTHQIQTLLQTGAKYGMVTMDKSLINLYKGRRISLDMLKKYAIDQEAIMRELEE